MISFNRADAAYEAQQEGQRAASWGDSMSCPGVAASPDTARGHVLLAPALSCPANAPMQADARLLSKGLQAIRSVPRPPHHLLTPLAGECTTQGADQLPSQHTDSSTTTSPASTLIRGKSDLDQRFNGTGAVSMCGPRRQLSMTSPSPTQHLPRPTSFAQHVASLRAVGSSGSSSGGGMSNASCSTRSQHGGGSGTLTSGRPPLFPTDNPQAAATGPADSRAAQLRAGMPQRASTLPGAGTTPPQPAPVLPGARPRASSNSNLPSSVVPVPQAVPVAASSMERPAAAMGRRPGTTSAIMRTVSDNILSFDRQAAATLSGSELGDEGHSGEGRRVSQHLDSLSQGSWGPTHVDPTALAALDALRPGTSRSTRAAAVSGVIRPGTAVCGVAASDGVVAGAFIGSTLASWFAPAAGASSSPWRGAREDKSPGGYMLGGSGSLHSSRAGSQESVDSGLGMGPGGMGALASGPVPMRSLPSKGAARGGVAELPRLPSIQGGVSGSSGGSGARHSNTHASLGAQSAPGSSGGLSSGGRIARPRTLDAL